MTTKKQQQQQRECCPPKEMYMMPMTKQKESWDEWRESGKKNHTK